MAVFTCHCVYMCGEEQPMVFLHNDYNLSIKTCNYQPNPIFPTQPNPILLQKIDAAVTDRLNEWQKRQYENKMS